jgi:hypothetical protein
MNVKEFLAILEALKKRVEPHAKHLNLLELQPTVVHYINMQLTQIKKELVFKNT